MARRIPTPTPAVDERDLQWTWDRLAWAGPDPRYFLRGDDGPERRRAEDFRAEMAAVRDELSELPLPGRVEAFTAWLDEQGYGEMARRRRDHLRAERDRAAERMAREGT